MFTLQYNGLEKMDIEPLSTFDIISAVETDYIFDLKTT